MALMECTECGRGLSERAIACPHCGDPKRPAASPWGIRLLLGILVLALALVVAVGLLLAWLVPNASHPIDIELPQRSSPSTSLDACPPHAACASTPLASR